MVHYAALWMFIGAVIVVALASLCREIMRVRDRTIDEVIDYVRPQASYLEIDAALFDPAMEAENGFGRAGYTFRRNQRMRFDLATQRLDDKRHAVWVIVQWANTEWHDMRHLHSEDNYTQEELDCMRMLRTDGKKLLWLMLLARTRSELSKLLLRLDKLYLLPVPKVGSLGRIFGVKIFELYEDIKEATARFAGTYGEEFTHEFRRLL